MFFKNEIESQQQTKSLLDKVIEILLEGCDAHTNQTAILSKVDLFISSLA